MPRKLSAIAPDWWDYTTLDDELIRDAAALTPEKMLGLSRPGFKVVMYDTLEEFYLAEALEYITAWKQSTPDNPVGLGPAGNYYVPTWDFGDIPVGGSSTRVLRFGVAGAITPNDPRYGAIMGSFQAPAGQGDVFLNRTTDLKIGDWLDELTRDSGVPYPTDWPLRGGNVSVFHNIPEPASLVLLAIGALLRRRAA